jgi:hypothetical protein
MILVAFLALASFSQSSPSVPQLVFPSFLSRSSQLQPSQPLVLIAFSSMLPL